MSGVILLERSSVYVHFNLSSRCSAVLEIVLLLGLRLRLVSLHYSFKPRGVEQYGPSSICVQNNVICSFLSSYNLVLFYICTSLCII